MADEHAQSSFALTNLIRHIFNIFLRIFVRIMLEQSVLHFENFVAGKL